MFFRDVLRDLQFALRQLRNNPGFTLLAVGTLALGIAANITIFSWINSTLLDPIPGVAHTSDMITIMRGERSEHPTPPFSYLDYAELRDGSRSFDGLLAYHHDFMSITGSGKPERIYGALTSSNYFETLGVKPRLGRSLMATLPNERVGMAEVVIGYDLWQNRYSGDPAIVGKTIQINLHPYTIVGVAPKGFIGCSAGLRDQIWIPLAMDSAIWGGSRVNQRDNRWLNVLGKLRPGVSASQAVGELNVLMQRIAERYPAEHEGPNQISSDPLWRSPFGANVYFYGTLPILLALAAVLLLLACANVANLLLVRSVARRREFAIRLSMGADRWRVVRQMLVENLLIAFAGGAFAVAITLWTAKSLDYFLPSTVLPLSLNGRVDGKVVLAALLVSILTAAISGVIPALRASGLSPVAVLKDESLSMSGGLSRSRLTSGLVIAQITLSLLLLTCAGLFVRSLEKAQRANPGFDPDGVLVASFDLGAMGYNFAQTNEFDRQLLAHLQQLPGVASASVADFSPLSFTIHSDEVRPEGYIPRPHESMEMDRGQIGPGYLATVRTLLLAGREFTLADDAKSQQVVIVNKELVDRYWPGQNALGKRVQVDGRWYTVVGVAANGKYRRMVYGQAPLVLVPMLQRNSDNQIIHVRTNGDPMAMASVVEHAVHDLNPDLPVYNVTSMRASMLIGNVFERIAVAFAGTFGLLALLLSAVGVYGVVAYSTRQRTHEIGIRMALGAARADVFRQVLGQGLRLALVGLGLGLVVSFAFTRLLQGMLFGIGANDWITFSVVPVVLLAVTMFACYLPARRAALVEPMRALRTE
jgi:Acidobacterial duplicated orphan permease